MNKRRRLAGLLVVLLASAGATAMALPAHALSPDDPNLNPCGVPGNLVVNCGFEAAPATNGALPGWTHLVSHNSGQSSGAVKSGGESLRFGSEGGDDVWTQTVPVAPNTYYIVGAQFFSTDNSGTTADDITLAATNVSGSSGAGHQIYTSTNANLTWSRGAQLVKTGSAHSMTLTLSGRNVPGETYVDDVFVLQQRAGCAAIANNLVHNCGFEASSTSPWVHSVDHQSNVTSTSNGGSSAIDLASTGSDDTWYQVLSVRPHTQYTLTYWVEYWSNGSPANNDLTVQVSNVATSGGSLFVTTNNVANRFWAPVTKTFTTGSGSTATLLFSGRNVPSVTNLDDFSLTAVSHIKVSAKGRKLTTTLTGVGGQKVQVQRYVHKHWKFFASFTAPKTGWSASWKITVPAGKYRAVASSAPGYASATSSSVTVH